MDWIKLVGVYGLDAVIIIVGGVYIYPIDFLWGRVMILVGILFAGAIIGSEIHHRNHKLYLKSRGCIK